MYGYTKGEIKEVMELVETGCDLTTHQASIFLSLSSRTLEKYRITGEGPRFYRYGRAVRYSVNDLQEWKSKRLFNSTSEGV